MPGGWHAVRKSMSASWQRCKAAGPASVQCRLPLAAMVCANCAHRNGFQGAEEAGAACSHIVLSVLDALPPFGPARQIG